MPFFECKDCKSFDPNQNLCCNMKAERDHNYTSPEGIACVFFELKLQKKEKKPMTCKCEGCKHTFEPIDPRLQEAWDKRKELLKQSTLLQARGVADPFAFTNAKSYSAVTKGIAAEAHADLIFIDAVLEVHGDVVMTWDGDDCCTVLGVTFK